MKVPFEKEESSIFGYIYRPYFLVDFWSTKIKKWAQIYMIVDSGADYTLLPKHYAQELGISLKNDTYRFTTGGVGGSATVYFLKNTHKVRIGNWERSIPLGIINSDEVPPLFGRHGFMETFTVTLNKRYIEIDNPKQ